VPNGDTITLRGMRFHTLVGVLPHEHELPQPLEIDVTVALAPAPEVRGAGRVLDYRVLYDLVSSTVTRGHTGYLEDLASELADRSLAIDRARGVRVAVRKPNVALPGPLEYAEVVVERERRG